MSLKLAINGLNAHKCMVWSTVRRLSSKYLSQKFENFESKDEKDLSKVKITLKDQKGDILGIKSINESKLLAKKLRMNLIEEKSENKYKYKVFQLVSNQDLAKMDTELSDNISAKGVKEVKRLVFSAKLSENDLMTKINQIKRWLTRGHQIVVQITNPLNDQKVFDKIMKTFENEFKLFGKINQKKIKSDKSLKFTITSIVESKDQLKELTSDGHSDDLDIDNLDPNQLLSDEFEEQLKEK